MYAKAVLVLELAERAWRIVYLVQFQSPASHIYDAHLQVAGNVFSPVGIWITGIAAQMVDPDLRLRNAKQGGPGLC